MIVLLHGALGSASQLEPIRDLITDEDVAIVEFPGHGKQPMVNDQWSIGSCAEYLEHELEKLSPATPAAIFGYSMGGYVALTLALRRPDLIGRILTLGTKLNWSPEAAQKEITMLNATAIESKVPAFASDLKRRHGQEHWKTVLANTAELIATLGANPLTHEQVNTLEVRVRYCVGDRDEMVTIGETIDFYRATPQAEFAVLPRTRHPIEKVDLRLLLDQMRSFFTQ